MRACRVRRRDVDQPLQPARPQQRRVDQLRPVGRPDHDHLAQRLGPVQLGEQRRDHPVGHPGVGRLAAPRGQRVDLVQEHQGRGGVRGPPEQLAHRPLGLPDVLVQQLRALHREHVELPGAGQRAQQEGLAAAGRAVDQHPARRRHPEPGERVGVLQRPQHRLGERLLDLGHVADLVQGDPAGLQGGRGGHRDRPDRADRVEQVLLADPRLVGGRPLGTGAGSSHSRSADAPSGPSACPGRRCRADGAAARPARPPPGAPRPGRRPRTREPARPPPAGRPRRPAAPRPAAGAAARSGPARRAAAAAARGPPGPAARSRGSTDSGAAEVATSASPGVFTAARNASSTRVASGGGSAAGSSASTSVTTSTVRCPDRAAACAAVITSCTRCAAAAASSAATPGATSSTALRGDRGRRAAGHGQLADPLRPGDQHAEPRRAAEPGEQLRLVEAQPQPLDQPAGRLDVADQVLDREHRLGRRGGREAARPTAAPRAGAEVGLVAGTELPVTAPPSQPTTVLGRTATAPAGSTPATVSSSVVQALPSAAGHLPARGRTRPARAPARCPGAATTPRPHR